MSDIDLNTVSALIGVGLTFVIIAAIGLIGSYGLFHLLAFCFG